MKKLIWFGLLVGIWGLLRADPSLAVSIDFEPAVQAVNLGNTFTMDIVVSGLGDGTSAEIVSTYDLDVTYDASLFSATGVTFSTSLGTSLQDSSLSAVGLVDLFAVSVESDEALNALQGDRVTLATLAFNAIGTGTGTFNFVFDEFNSVVGREAQPLSLTAGSSSVQVGINPVPEPGTWLLLATGCVGLLALGWRRRQRAA